ncbi:hypothetical protein [Streptomyces sp. NPDC039016]|uniref:hypothetical protein n=1 Tax=Streptomyces sp. NPDC039016 TaxID=3154330 RepID=UPI00340A17D9
MSISDDDRDRLISRFWDFVTDGPDVHPGYVERLHSPRPHLPEEPSTEQLEAWTELAPGHRDPVRQDLGKPPCRTPPARFDDLDQRPHLGRSGSRPGLGPGWSLAWHGRVELVSCSPMLLPVAPWAQCVGEGPDGAVSQALGACVGEADGNGHGCSSGGCGFRDVGSGGGAKGPACFSIKTIMTTATIRLISIRVRPMGFAGL